MPAGPQAAMRISPCPSSHCKRFSGRPFRTNMPFFMARDIAIEVVGMDLTAMSDEKWVVYILEQILHNASKYTPGGGVVRVTGSRTDKGVTVEIQDTGMGIAASDLPRIFDKGFTGENGRRTEKIHRHGSLLHQAGGGSAGDSIAGGVAAGRRHHVSIVLLSHRRLVQPRHVNSRPHLRVSLGRHLSAVRAAT